MWISDGQDYYSGGMVMPERSFSTDQYRFGFNTQEKVNEVSGSANHNTALFWEYDTRTGRRWNLDPKGRIGISDYSAFGGNPILYSDHLGDIFGIEGFGSNKTQRQKARTIAREHNGTINHLLRSHINVTYSGYDNDLLSNSSKGLFTTSINPNGSISTIGSFAAQPTIGPDNTPPAVKQFYAQQASRQDFINRMYAEAGQMSPMGLMLQGKNIIETLPFVYGTELLRGAMLGAEAKAGLKLMQMEKNAGGHFVAEHGAWTTLDQQLFRITNGITPSGIYSPSSAASRFFTNELQLQSVETAQTIFQQTGKTAFSFNMGTTIGEGYLANQQYMTTSIVQAYFRNGQLHTLFPKLK